MAKKVVSSAPPSTESNGGTQQDGSASRGALGADIIIANAPDPVFVSDLEGKILQANDAVSQLLGFRPDELIEQSLSASSARRRRASSPPPCARSSRRA